MRWSSAAFALVVAAAVARADTTPASDDELRAYVRGQLDAQAEVLARTRATVDDKLAAATADRARRVRAAYRLLRAGSACSAAPPARRRR